MAKSPKKIPMDFNGQANRKLPPNSYDYEHDNRPELAVFMFRDIRNIPDHDPQHDVFLNGGYVLYLYDFDHYADRIWLANAYGFNAASQFRLDVATSPLRYMKVAGYFIKTLPEITDEEWMQIDKPMLRTDFKLNKIDYKDVISIVRIVDAGPVPSFTAARPRYMH